MPIDHWFPTNIYYKDGILDNRLDEYRKLAYELVDYDRRHPFWESKLKSSFHAGSAGMLQDDPRFYELSSEALYYSQDFARFLGYDDHTISNLYIENMWANVISGNDYHGLHSHLGSIISGVFYVDAPDEAVLTIGSPQRKDFYPARPQDQNDYTCESAEYLCVPGRIILFRSGTDHGYDAHGSEKDKISIPFNINITNGKQ